MPKYGIRGLFITCAVVAILTSLGIWVHKTFWGTGLRFVSAHAANNLLDDFLELPAGAYDVTIYSDYVWTEIDLSITEIDLVKWCKSNSFELIPLNTNSIAFEPCRLNTKVERFTIKDGYRIVLPNGRGGFDRRSGRAFIICYRL